MEFVKEIERITEEMEKDGTFENMIRERIKKSFQDTLDNAFRSYGTVGKLVEGKISERMVQSIENYNWDEYIPKLDAVLTDIINSTAVADSKIILENFKELMVDADQKSIKVSELFDAYKEVVAEFASHDDHEVNTDEEPYYDPIEVEYFFEKADKPRWSSLKKGIITFKVNDTDENEEDKRINVQIPVERWDWEQSEGYLIESSMITDVANLREMSDLELMVLKLSRAKTRIIIDVESDSDTVKFNDTPEASWS